MRSLLACGLALLVALEVHTTATPTQPLRFVTVSAGADHVCALTDHGEAYCWGSNEFGQLGHGSADSLPHPVAVRVRAEVEFTVVSAGFTHTCGLARDRSAWCWGANDTAQLGDGSLKNSPTPVRVSTDVRFQAIGAGGGHTCGVSDRGIGYCWGGNWHGQLGVGNRDGDAAAPCCYRVPSPILTDLRFRMVAAGGISSCGVAVDGKAYCWGSPQEGRLGTGRADAANKSADKTTPTAVVGDTRFQSVLPRTWHTCGLSSTHAALCWGGDMFRMKSAVPEPVSIRGKLSVVTTGHFHDCALTRSGTAYCWGTNADGEIGDGTQQDAASPQRVATNRRFSSIAAGGNVFVAKAGDVTTWGFTCGLTADDRSILCWGDNRHGALGNGSTERALTPVPIAKP